MKRVMSFVLICMLCACSTTTIGDGKVDTVELATVQLAVGMAFAAKPQTVLPAYGVSTALLAVMADGTGPVTLPLIEKAIAKEVDKLKLDVLTKQAFMDLVNLIKAQALTLFDKEGLPGAERLVVTRTLIQMVHDSAEARLK